MVSFPSLSFIVSDKLFFTLCVESFYLFIYLFSLLSLSVSELIRLPTITVESDSSGYTKLTLERKQLCECGGIDSCLD